MLAQIQWPTYNVFCWIAQSYQTFLDPHPIINYMTTMTAQQTTSLKDIARLDLASKKSVQHSSKLFIDSFHVSGGPEGASWT